MAGAWEWASSCSRCHMSQPRGASLRAALECEWEARLLAAALVVESPWAAPLVVESR